MTSMMVASLSDVDALKLQIPHTLELLDEFRQAMRNQGFARLRSVDDLRRRRMPIPVAYQHGSRYPYDYSDYVDDSEMVATLVRRHIITNERHQPQSVVPVVSVLRQWEIPDLTRGLFLTEKGSFACTIPSTVMYRELRREVTVNHPWVTGNAKDISRGLKAICYFVEFALEGV